MKRYFCKIIIFVLSIIALPILVEAKPVNEAFDDDNFYNCVVDAYNEKNPDSHKEYTDNLSDSELQSITNLECNGRNKQENEMITSAKGLEKLTSLTDLSLSINKLSTINLNQNVGLKNLNLSSNDLLEIDLSKNIALTTVGLGSNNLTEINLSYNKEITTLAIGENKLSKINLENLSKLESLYLENNNLTEIDISENPMLNYLHLGSNSLKHIDLTNNLNLDRVYLNNNNIENINIPSNLNFSALWLNNNNLLSLDLNNLSFKDYVGYGKENFKSQTRELKPYKKADTYILNLKDYDNNLNPSKVVFENTNKITYDNKTGIFTFKKLPKEISYIYKTGLPSETGISEDMDVTITLVGGEEYNEENINNNSNKPNNNGTSNNKSDKSGHEDEEGDQKDTGSITIGLFVVLGITLCVVYKFKYKKNKLFKL